MIHKKISGVTFILLISMPLQGWWLSDWLFNKPTPPTIAIERASKDVLTIATVLAGVTLLGGYWSYKRYWNTKEEVQKQQKIIQEKEAKMNLLMQENNTLKND